MAKMKKGIRGIGFAIGTNNNGVISYGDVQYLITNQSGGREYTAEPRGDSQDIYADSVKVYGDTVNDGYDLNVTLLSLLDGEVEEKWLGMSKTAAGMAEYASNAENPYFALIIHEDTSDNVGLITVYYWCQASGRPSKAGKTAEGGAFDWAFAEVPLVASPRPSDKLVKMELPGTAHLTQIPEPGSVVTTPSINLAKHAISMVYETTFDLGVNTVPANATVTWTSSSTSIATVSDGTITAKDVGNTIITASITVDGVTYTDTCTVVVTAS